MKARVFVSPKRTVLDPQGATIARALRSHGHESVQDVRQGKVFEIELAATDRAAAEKEITGIAADVLANPVIEEYRVEILD